MGNGQKPPRRSRQRFALCSIPGYDPMGPYATKSSGLGRYAVASEPPLLPGPWRQRHGGVDGAVRVGASKARPRRGRHRSSRRKAEDALPAFHSVVPSAADVVVGGHSFGGRVASLAAAEPDAPYAALVLFSYPLHPPGRPERTGRPHRSLAIDPLPGPAAVGRIGSIRPDRPPSGGSAAASGRPACDVSAARTRGRAGSGGRPGSRRRVPGQHRRNLTTTSPTDQRDAVRECSFVHKTDAECTACLLPTDGLVSSRGSRAAGSPGRGAPPMSPSEAQVPRVRSCARAPIAIRPTFGALTALFWQEGGVLRVVHGRLKAVFVAAFAAILLIGIPTPPPTFAADPPGLARFMTAIGRVESGGRYTARNARTGAYGKYQIIPSSWRGWARLYLHNANARKTPANQERSPPRSSGRRTAGSADRGGGSPTTG